MPDSVKQQLNLASLQGVKDPVQFANLVQAMFRRNNTIPVSWMGNMTHEGLGNIDPALAARFQDNYHGAATIQEFARYSELAAAGASQYGNFTNGFAGVIGGFDENQFKRFAGSDFEKYRPLHSEAQAINTEFEAAVRAGRNPEDVAREFSGRFGKFEEHRGGAFKLDPEQEKQAQACGQAGNEAERSKCFQGLHFSGGSFSGPPPGGGDYKGGYPAGDYKGGYPQPKPGENYQQPSGGTQYQYSAPPADHPDTSGHIYTGPTYTTDPSPTYTATSSPTPTATATSSPTPTATSTTTPICSHGYHLSGSVCVPDSH